MSAKLSSKSRMTPIPFLVVRMLLWLTVDKKTNIKTFHNNIAAVIAGEF